MAEDTGNQASAASRHTYHLYVWRIWAGPLGLWLAAAIFVWAPTGTNSPFGLIVFVWFLAAVLFILGIYLLWGKLQTRLVISPYGIEYSTMGMRVRSGWDNVVGAEYVVLENGQEVRGLRLRESELELSPWVRAGEGILPKLNQISSLKGFRAPDSYQGFGDGIPVGRFVDDWEQGGEPGDEMRRYAPQAFGAVRQSR